MERIALVFAIVQTHLVNMKLGNVNVEMATSGKGDLSFIF